MAEFDQQEFVFITSPKVLSPYLERELHVLGFTETEIRPAGVKVKASLYDCMRLNLQLRTAHRILFPLFEGNANDLSELYTLAYQYDWSPWIALDGQFAVKSTTKDVDVAHTNMVNLKVKDAIADRFRADKGKRPNSGASDESVIVSVNWVHNEVQFYIDLSGESLNRRGYKKDNWKAALQESLAAAMVLEANITANSLVHNPMCGSGTLALEAIMVMYGVWPGVMKRKYAMENLPDFPSDLWQSLVRLHSQRPGAPFNRIYASDVDMRALKAARKNSNKLKMDHFVYWEVCDFEHAKTYEEDGERIFLMNPPYGYRLGSQKEVNDVYQRIGKYIAKQKYPAKFLVLGSDEKLLNFIGLTPSKSQVFYNTKLKVLLNTYTMNP